MRLTELKNNLPMLNSYKQEIVERWCSDDSVQKSLAKLMDIESFKNEYATGVLEHYINIIEGGATIGDCPIIRKFLALCSQKEIPPHELYLICAGFKKSILLLFVEKNIFNKKLFEEIIFVTDQNLAGVLELYKEFIKQKDVKISEQENWIKQYINVINNALIVSTTDEKGIITHANQNFCNVSGYSRDELVGKPHNIVRHPDSDKEQFEELWATIKSKKPWTGIIKNRKKDGSAYYVSTIIFPLLNTKGEIVEYMSTRIDITELFRLYEDKEKMEELMLQHTKMVEMGEMLGIIAHQWKQPLSIISMCATMMHEELDGLNEKKVETLKSRIQKILEQIKLMSDIISTFRDFYKPDKQKSVFKACELAKEVYRLIDVRMKKLNIEFIVKEHEHFEVLGYKNDFKQVILNIYGNACDKLEESKEEHKKIELEFENDESIGKIIIKDNGGGIPKELLPDKLFENYVTTKGEKGTGIGLKLCRSVIEKKMGGKISASNSSNGAVFTIELPLHTPSN